MANGMEGEINEVCANDAVATAIIKSKDRIFQEAINQLTSRRSDVTGASRGCKLAGKSSAALCQRTVNQSWLFFGVSPAWNQSAMTRVLR